MFDTLPGRVLKRDLLATTPSAGCCDSCGRDIGASRPTLFRGSQYHAWCAQSVAESEIYHELYPTLARDASNRSPA
jgi:hypothetical protein